MVSMIALSACVPRIEFYQTTDLHSANEVEALLRARAIAVERRPLKGGVALSVSDRDFPEAVAVLRDAGLPREAPARLADVFGKKGMMPTPLEEKARYIRAIEQEIESAVLDIAGVVAARARIVPLDRHGHGAPAVPPSASLLIRHRADVELSGLVPGLVQLVKNGVPGLADEDDRRVAVMLVAEPGRAAPAMRPPGTGAGPAPSSLAWPLPALFAAACAFALGWLARGVPWNERWGKPWRARRTLASEPGNER